MYIENTHRNEKTEIIWKAKIAIAHSTRNKYRDISELPKPP